MSNKYLVGVDLGTTGTKSVVFDLEGNVVGVGYLDTPTYYPRPGWVAQDAQAVVDLMFESTKKAIADSGVRPEDIAGVGFTHMCTTFVPVDKDGNFLHTILLWNDLRGGEMFEFVRDRWASVGITEQDDYEFTGYPLNGLSTLPKVLWFQKHYPDLYEKTYKFVGMQALMTKAYTGEVYLDDKPGMPYSKLANASKFEFDPERAKLYGVDLDKYCDRADPGDQAGVVSKEAAAKTGLLEGTPVFVGAGDQRCAAVGAGVAKDGMMSMCFGTAGVLHAYTSEWKFHPEGKITILGHAGTGHWQVEGNSSSGASSLGWYADNFAQLEKGFAAMNGESVFPYLTNAASKSPVGARGLIYTAWLAGQDCPNFDVNASATLTGMTFSHTKNDITRAVMEGVCFETMTMIEVADQTLGHKPEVIRAIGGGSKSPFWNQMQADVYNRRIETLESTESTALAAAMFAAIGAGFYKDVHEGIENMVRVKDGYDPNPDNVPVYGELFELYKELYADMSKRVFPKLKKFQDQHVK